MSDPSKFKTRKSWNEFGHSHFLTFSTLDKRPYLDDHRICRLLANRINEASQELNFAVLAYVFMPDHSHLLIHPIEDEYVMADILKAMKQGPSKSARNRGWTNTVLWEPGGGHDSNISNRHARVEAIDYIHQNPIRKELVEDPLAYRWSSANWYVTGEQGDVRCMHLGELWN